LTHSNRTALITGASRGLGEVIARVLAGRGYDLVLGARDSAALDRVAQSLSVHGSRIVPVAGDVVDASVRARLVNTARELGGLNLLVNNASALGSIGPLLDFDVPRFGQLFPVNVALELLTRTLAAELGDRGISAVLVDPGDMRTRMHQEAFPGEDISDRPLPEVTVPFWNWLLDQDPEHVRGKRFAAQQGDGRWLQQAS
jgi:NAD(P)-dependent dehydrogenase (short-subunit alcohol dehydrogenase family)